MNTQFQSSFLGGLLIRAPVLPPARSRVGRRLGLAHRYDRQMHRARNRDLATAVATDQHQSDRRQTMSRP